MNKNSTENLRFTKKSYLRKINVNYNIFTDTGEI